ncbi:MAG: hypothetical protein M1814_002937 [Vezdaea aestivalis]|nr:MAG: hypothetical protein M1814_002937 [Vezdaea aestivalis]
MVTGVECAGLVLASFPVLIEALKFYSKGLQTTKSLWRYHKHFERLLNWIKYENLIFSNNLQNVLQDCLAGQMAALLDNPTGELWKDQGVVAAIQKRLGTQYGSYMDVLQIMNEELQQFKVDLGVDDQLQAKSDSQQHRIFLKKLKFSIREEEFEKRRKELTRANEALQKLVALSSPETTFSKPVRSSGIIKSYGNIAKAADYLYSLLYYKLFWLCKCSGRDHSASLVLGCLNTDLPSSLSFKLIFSLRQDWKGGIVQPTDDQTGKELDSQSPPSLLGHSAPQSSRQALLQRLSSKIGKTKRIGSSPNLIPGSDPNLRGKSYNIFNQEVDLIDDLCRALNRHRNILEPTSLEVITHLNLPIHRVTLTPELTRFKSCDTLRLWTLKELIGRRSPIGSGNTPILSRKE